jgi:hypothetical protein
MMGGISMPFFHLENPERCAVAPPSGKNSEHKKIYLFEGRKKRPRGAQDSSRGWSEAESPDLSPNLSRPGWGGGKIERIWMRGGKTVNDVYDETALRPAGTRQDGFPSGGSASLHPRLLPFAPPGQLAGFDSVT